MVPAVGASAARMSFAVVVLPQPDSPTRPRVSPVLIVKLTPSTALTQPRLLPRREPPTGKYFLRPRTSSNGSLTGGLLQGLPAPDGPAVAQGLLAGLFSTATVQGVRAAGVKAAARRQGREIWRLAGDGVERLLAPQLRHGVEQSSGVGVLRCVEQVPHRLHLDDLAGVHYRYFVTHLGHNAQVVGDEDEGHATGALQVL